MFSFSFVTIPDMANTEELFRRGCSEWQVITLSFTSIIFPAASNQFFFFAFQDTKFSLTSIYTAFCGVKGHWEFRGQNYAIFVKDTRTFIQTSPSQKLRMAGIRVSGFQLDNCFYAASIGFFLLLQDIENTNVSSSNQSTPLNEIFSPYLASLPPVEHL